jgi:hypothetical protein
LQKEVVKIRSANLSAQIRASKKEITPEETTRILIANNQRLVEIAGEALKLVKKPFPGCYAVELCKKK